MGVTTPPGRRAAYVTRMLGCNPDHTARLVAEASGTWSRYAAGDHTQWRGLATWLAGRCAGAPRQRLAQRRKVGLELEFPVVRRATGRGLDRSSVQALWEAFAERDTSWSFARESIVPVVTGLRRQLGDFSEHVDTDASVCTVEIALAPQETVDQAAESARSVMSDLRSLLWENGYTLLSAGIQPITSWCHPGCIPPGVH
jgi:gamma-glutamylcysteine synthetase